jgi:hypothetical protein
MCPRRVIADSTGREKVAPHTFRSRPSPIPPDSKPSKSANTTIVFQKLRTTAEGGRSATLDPSGVARAIDLSHSARTKRRHDFVGTKFGAIR